MSKQNIVMIVIVLGALVLYIWGLAIIGGASLAATEKAPEVNKLWVDMVAAVTTVLAMNAGAYLGLPSQRFFRFDIKDSDTVRLAATIIYFVALVVSFVIAATSAYPHASLTDMGGTLVGFVAGVLSVIFGRK